MRADAEVPKGADITRSGTDSPRGTLDRSALTTSTPGRLYLLVSGGLVPRLAVELLPHHVQMTGMASCLLQHMNHDPSQAHVTPEPRRLGAESIERGGFSRDQSRPVNLGAIERHDGLGGVIGTDSE